MKIAYFNNCWFTNVGEAFIDIGGMDLTKKIFDKKDCQIVCISNMSDYYARNAPGRRSLRSLRWRKSLPKTFNISDYICPDYVILPGMMCTVEFLNSPERNTVDELVAKGCKAIFLGAGGIEYNNNEVDSMKKYFDKIKPTFVMSRDNETYENYKNIVPCIKGIDCAFWSIDAFNPRGFADKEYDVITFNRITEPKELKCVTEGVVRPWHMQYSYRKKQNKNTMMISDSPYDYLSIYANAKKVYTDLVHATIISLMYGKPVRFWKTDRRSQAVYALSELHNKDGWLTIASDALERQKRNILNEIKARFF